MEQLKSELDDKHIHTSVVAQLSHFVHLSSCFSPSLRSSAYHMSNVQVAMMHKVKLEGHPRSSIATKVQLTAAPFEQHAEQFLNRICVRFFIILILPRILEDA